MLVLPYSSILPSPLLYFLNELILPLNQLNLIILVEHELYILYSVGEAILFNKELSSSNFKFFR